MDKDLRDRLLILLTCKESITCPPDSQNGDIKLVANLEYRARLFGNLGGALFIDAGNVWRRKAEHTTYDDLGGVFSVEEIDFLNHLEDVSQLRLSTFADQVALGTGFGLRYDLGFLVVRVDWGLALHLPYATGRSRYFCNWDRFSEAQALHFAIGYPF